MAWYGNWILSCINYETKFAVNDLRINQKQWQSKLIK